MRKLVAVENVSLDGVMQAPGRPDEDLYGGFEHGGWAKPYPDAVMGQAMGQGMANAGAMLFGRRTYIDFFNVWQTWSCSAPGADCSPTLLGSKNRNSSARSRRRPAS